MNTSEVFEQVSTSNKKTKTKACKAVGLYPVVDQGQLPVSGYIDDADKVINVDSPIIIFGDHTRVIKWINHDFVPGADGTKVLSPKQYLLPRFFYYQLRSIELPDKGYSRHFKYLKESIFHVPALAEQKVIASKLDKLLTQTDTIKARLDNITVILKRFRQSILADAVSGKITKEWRSINKDITLPINNDPQETEKKSGRHWGSGEVVELTNKEISLIPKSWEWRKVKDLNRGESVVQIGPMSMKSKDFTENGIPVLNVGCVQYGYFVHNKLNYLPKSKLNEFIRYQVKKGDVVFTRSGTVGRCSVVSNKENNFLMTFHLLRARPSVDICRSEYLYFAFRGAPSVSRQTKESQIGATRAGFNTKLLENIDIPLPPIEEQIEIIHNVEQYFSFIEQIEHRVNNAQTRINNLTQSILAKAFRGELTKEWREQNLDLISEKNSAEALLKSIKPKLSSNKAKKKRKSKT